MIWQVSMRKRYIRTAHPHARRKKEKKRKKETKEKGVAMHQDYRDQGLLQFILQLH
jgi:hypothetical protein